MLGKSNICEISNWEDRNPPPIEPGKAKSTEWKFSKPPLLIPFQQNNLEAIFKERVINWKKETKGLSLDNDKFSNINYLEIIGMGKPAIPLILREMEENSGHWFLALRAITKEDLIKKEDYGSVRLMKETWLEWGKLNKYI